MTSFLTASLPISELFENVSRNKETFLLETLDPSWQAIIILKCIDNFSNQILFFLKPKLISLLCQILELLLIEGREDGHFRAGVGGVYHL